MLGQLYIYRHNPPQVTSSYNHNISQETTPNYCLFILLDTHIPNMDPSTSAYIFDEYGMTWITCDLCSGSFQRQL